MPSTAAAMDGGGGDAGDAQNHPGGLNVIGFGQMDHMPQFYREDLVNMTGVAMSTEDGMVDMAGGVANYRQTQINTLADQLADDPDNINLRTQLQGVMLDDAELRAFTTKIAGETEINEAYDTDQQRQFWSNLVAKASSRCRSSRRSSGPSSSTGSTWAQVRSTTPGRTRRRA